MPEICSKCGKKIKPGTSLIDVAFNPPSLALYHPECYPGEWVGGWKRGVSAVSMVEEARK